MKFYLLIPKSLKPFFETELEDYRTCLSKGELNVAWNHLERAHIIGQRYPFAHSYVHWQMLKFGIRIKNSKEVLGQLPRLVFGGVKSFVGTIPVGNPGGSNVPPLKAYPIDEEIQEVFEKAGIRF